MDEKLMYWVYDTMTGQLVEEYRMPGVEDAFDEGAYCMQRYEEAMQAYERLLDRLGEVDEDKDVEIMRNAYDDIQRELCLRMYRYSAIFGK